MNEELAVAIEELRVRSRDRTWFLPVVLAGGEVPDRPIGAGETLRAFNYTRLTLATWEHEATDSRGRSSVKTDRSLIDNKESPSTPQVNSDSEIVPLAALVSLVA